MEIHGWVAISKHDLILSSFRKKPTEASNAARQALRLLGGQPLVDGFRLVQATLAIHDDTIGRETEIK